MKQQYLERRDRNVAAAYERYIIDETYPNLPGDRREFDRSRQHWWQRAAGRLRRPVMISTFEYAATQALLITLSVVMIVLTIDYLTR